MTSDKITIFFGIERITLLYSLFPFWTSKFSNKFVFTTDLEWVLKKDRNQKILLVRCFKTLLNKEGRTPFILRLKNKYKKVFIFDDNDGTESFYLDLLPFVDKYYKKQLFIDKVNYSKDFIGRRLHSDYYQRLMSGSISTPDKVPNPPMQRDLEKMSILWNIGIGLYPLSGYIEFLAKKGVNKFGRYWMKSLLSSPRFLTCPKPILQKCHARFGYEPYSPEVGFQRKMLLELVKNDNDFLSGKVDKKRYQKEISQVQLVLSPFGWGEICFRDFEAILHGAVLIKPNVSHLETWPNIFIPNETYIPVDWDGNDLKAKIKTLLDNQHIVSEVRNHAWDTYRHAFLSLDERVLQVIADFES